MKRVMCIANGIKHPKSDLVSVCGELVIDALYWLLEPNDPRYKFYEALYPNARGDSIFVSRDDNEGFKPYPDEFFMDFQE
jgi:hypothetical protein